MLFGKKQRALERERDGLKEEREVLKKELRLRQERIIELGAQIDKITNPPEGCKVGNWCAGCKYAEYARITFDQPIIDKGVVIRWVCLYGACEKRETAQPIPYNFTGCV